MTGAKRTLTADGKKILCISILLAALNISVILCFGLWNFSFEERKLTAFQILFSAGAYIFYIAFCIFMRFKRTSKLAKGIFCYQLIGSASYILYFVCFIFGIPLASPFYGIFHSWSVIFDPIMVAIGRFTGIRAKYLAAIFYLILTFITGKTVIAIRKDIAYDRKYKEDHAHEHAQ